MNNLRKYLPLMAAALLAGALLLLVGCEKEKEIHVSKISFTSCISHKNTGQKGHRNPDSIVVRTNNGTIYVSHFFLCVNCGFENVTVSLQISGDTVNVTEKGVPDNTANCMCEVNNSFRINNIPQGKYHLFFYNGMDDKLIYDYSINL